MKKRQKNIYKIILFLILGAMLFTLTSCDNQKPYEWTILVYMAADNSLYANALSDINEIESAAFPEKKIKIILLSDLLYMPDSERIPEDNYIYDIHHDDDINNVTSPIIKYEGELDTGNYNTLSDFANWAYKKYPGIHKALFIWSHGDGWYSYANRFCVDHSSLHYFNIPEGDLKKGIDQINYPIDILGLDACNMQCLEVLSEVKDNVGFVIGSEYEIQADGFPYNDIITQWQQCSLNKNLSETIAEDFFNSYMPGGSQNYVGNIYPITISAFENLFYPQLLDDLHKFLSNDLSSIKSEIKTARDGCNSLIDQDYGSQIDIKEFFVRLKTQLQGKDDISKQVDKIIDDIDQCFIYSNFYLFSENMGNASVWFPTDLPTYQNMINDYQKLSFDKIGWDKIIDVYFSD